MFTARARTFLVAAGVLYLFANQTQVGWLYAMSALLAGVALAGVWLGRGALQGIAAERRPGTNPDAEHFEGEPISIELALRHEGRVGAAQLRVTEHCPLSAPDAPEHKITMFVPSLLPHAPVQFDYETTLYRRGLHRFPPLNLESRAPFGFFERRREIDLPTPVLVYPEVRPLHRLDLLDRQLAPEVPRPKAGVGYEVLGVRPFRSGDSPRQVHWRSVARTGHLISKEYADEAEPGLTLALDLFRHPYPQTESKHTPFEWAVKCAASIGDYALTKRYPLHILADDTVLPVPVGPVDRWGLLQYLARVAPMGSQPFAALLARPVQVFVVALILWTDRSLIAPLLELQRHRIEVLAVVIDPQSFPDAGTALPSAAPLVDEMRSVNIETRLIKFSDDVAWNWAQQLSDTMQFRQDSSIQPIRTGRRS